MSRGMEQAVDAVENGTPRYRQRRAQRSDARTGYKIQPDRARACKTGDLSRHRQDFRCSPSRRKIETSHSLSRGPAGGKEGAGSVRDPHPRKTRERLQAAGALILHALWARRGAKRQRSSPWKGCMKIKITQNQQMLPVRRVPNRVDCSPRRVPRDGWVVDGPRQTRRAEVLRWGVVGPGRFGFGVVVSWCSWFKVVLGLSVPTTPLGPGAPAHIPGPTPGLSPSGTGTFISTAPQPIRAAVTNTNPWREWRW